MSTVNFQRRHYEFIADIIRDTPSIVGREVSSRTLIAQHFANALRATNPNFNFDRFLKACEVEQ